jgi:hypothetical protein
VRRRVAAVALALSAIALGTVTVKSARNPDVRARAAALVQPARALLGIHAAATDLGQSNGRRGEPPVEDPPVATLYDTPKAAGEARPANTAGEETDETTDPNGSDGPTPGDSPNTKPDPTSAASDDTDESELAKAEGYAKKGQYLFALTTYRKLGKANDTDARVLRGWSEAAVKTKGWGEALRVAIKWASSDPSPEAQLYLARIQHAAGQRYGAIATLTRLVGQHPDAREAEELLDRYADKKLASR